MIVCESGYDNLINRLDRTKHIPKFGGYIWYVNGSSGSNYNDGKSPDMAFETIGKGILVMNAGDVLNVHAGTYTEEGLDLALNATEIRFEKGVILNPAHGTALTISGNLCQLTGTFKITPGAGDTGIAVIGAECIVNGAKILTGAIGILVTGAGVVLNDCAVGFPTITAYDLQGAQGRLYRCKTVGNASTIGYKINSGADTGVLENCTSAGHQTSGFYIDTGCQDWTIFNCSSGAGDGKARDVDDANVWTNFSFADELHKSITLNNSTSYNLFQLTGAVEIILLVGHVDTVLVGANTDCYFQLYSVGGNDNISKTTDTDLGAAAKHTTILKNEDAGKGLEILVADQPRVEKAPDPKKQSAILLADPDDDTFVRWIVDGDDDDGGVIHFICKWKPLTDDGFLKIA